MSLPRTIPEARYTALVDCLIHHPDVTHTPDEIQSNKFGASALKVNNKIFAMLVKDRLVVKLPKSRVDALIASGDGQRFDPGHGRVMKEWLTLEPTSGQDWLPLAKEALTFVASKR